MKFYDRESELALLHKIEQTGGFLDRLEKEYGLIKKIRPVLSKPGSRSVKYTIEDNFLSFWFRFIYKHRSAVEAGNVGYIKDVILRDYNTYSGKILEKYFVAQVKLKKQYNIIGTYWERGNQNEIDIVAVNEAEKKLLVVEVKRNGANIQMEKLKEKSAQLVQQFNHYSVEYRGYSLDDM